MEKIITAIGNSTINDRLKETQKYIVQVPDIELEEDIIDILKEKKDTTVIIINTSIIKKEKIINFIEEIKKEINNIKIIAILEKEDEIIKNNLIGIGVYNILIGNKIDFFELEKLINKEINKEEFLMEEINNLKRIILEKNKKSKIIKKYTKIIHEKIKNNIILKNEYIQPKERKTKIISIIGTSGVGKSVFTAILSRAIKNRKILIIDLDVLNKSIKTIFDVKEKIAEEKEVWLYKKEETIINITKEIDLIDGSNIVLDCDKKIKINKLNELINSIKKEYDYIFLDTSSECFFDFTKEIMEFSDLSILLTGANLLELKKTKNLLNIYINEWKINKEKIKIIFNKYNQNSIDNNVLKKLFIDFKILGYIKLNEKNEYLINKKINYLDEKIKNEYLKILEKI